MIGRAWIIIVLALTSVSALADTGDDALGRVFMSPAEREELDRLRLMKPAAESSGPLAPGVTVEEEAPAPPATGYILRSQGAAWVWQDGDFRRVKRNEVDQKQPDERVRIERHKRPSDDGRSPAPDSTGDNGDDVEP